MNWEAMGAIGEVAGAVGVIATLGYLAVQIRQNTSSVRASSFQEAVRDMATASDVLASNAELSRIWRAGLRDLDGLEPDERQQFAAYALGLFRRMENIFFQTRHGTLDAESWEGLLASVGSILSQPGGAEWWARARGLREHPSGDGHAA